MMDHDGKHVMLTCLFLAAKCENIQGVSIEAFTKNIPGADAAHVLALEGEVAKALRFHLHVRHAYVPLYGFILDMEVLKIENERIGIRANVPRIVAVMKQ